MRAISVAQISRASDRVARDLTSGECTDEKVFYVDLGNLRAEIVVSGTRAATGAPPPEAWIADQLNVLARRIGAEALREWMATPLLLTG